MFTRATGFYLPSGNVCDPTFIFNRTPFTACDLYVKVIIDGQKVFQTTIIEADEVHFYEIFSSKIMSKHAEVKLELRDDDDGSTDDLLIRMTGTINDILGPHSIQDQENYFDFVTSWRDEYEDEA